MLQTTAGASLSMHTLRAYAAWGAEGGQGAAWGGRAAVWAWTNNFITLLNEGQMAIDKREGRREGGRYLSGWEQREGKRYWDGVGQTGETTGKLPGELLETR